MLRMLKSKLKRNAAQNRPKEDDLESDVYEPSDFYGSSWMDKKRSSRYSRDYATYNYWDEYSPSANGYEDQIMGAEHDMFEHVPDDRSRYYGADELYDESEFEWNNENDYFSEYPSDYRAEQGSRPVEARKQRQTLETPRRSQKLRNSIKPNSRHRDRRKQELGDGARMKMPYQQDTNVYLARAPIGHKAFRAASREIDDVDGYENSETYSEETLSEEEEEEGFMTRPEYEVYAAHTKEGTANIFKKQKKTREQVVSVTEYDNNYQMIGYKNKNRSEKVNENSLVYLPVVIVDKNSHNQNKPADEQLERNKELYLADNTGQGIVSEQAQNRFGTDNKPSQMTLVNPVALSSINPFKKKSKTSRSSTKEDPKVKRTKSKSRISKTSSIASSPSRSIIQVKSSPSKSERISRSHSKARQNTKESKMKSSSGFSSKLPSAQTTIQERRSSLVGTLKPEREKDNLNHTFVSNPTPEPKSYDATSLEEKQIINNKSEVSGASFAKGNSMANTPSKNTENELIAMKSQKSERKESNGLRSLESSKLVGTGSIERGKSGIESDTGRHSEPKVKTLKSISELQQSESKVLVPKKRSLTKNPYKGSKTSVGKYEPIKPRSILHYDDKMVQNQSPSNDPVLKPSSVEQSKLSRLKKNKSHRERNLSKSVSKKGSEFTRVTREYYRFITWMFSESPIVYLFELAQFFLGISMHSTLMEVLRNFKPYRQKQTVQ